MNTKLLIATFAVTLAAFSSTALAIQVGTDNKNKICQKDAEVSPWAHVADKQIYKNNNSGTASTGDVMSANK